MPETANSRTIRVALAQIRVDPADPDGNVERAVAAVRAAKGQGAEAVVLPECLDHGWTSPTARDRATTVPDGYACRALSDIARQQAIVVCAGLTERDGPQVYNTAVLIESDGSLLHKHRKVHELAIGHQTYDRGDRLAVVESSLGAIGVLVCADACSDEATLLRGLGAMGAEVVLSPCAWAVRPDYDNDAEPYGALWHDTYVAAAGKYRMPVVGVSYVGPVVGGAWDGWNCIGCSLAVDSDATVAAKGPYGADAAWVETVELHAHRRGHAWA